MLKAGFGMIALAGVALATPAAAQGLYIEGKGVAVGVGERPHHRRHDAVVIRERDAYAYERCKTTRIIRSDGSSKTIRRCH